MRIYTQNEKFTIWEDTEFKQFKTAAKAICEASER